MNIESFSLLVDLVGPQIQNHHLRQHVHGHIAQHISVHGPPLGRPNNDIWKLYSFINNFNLFFKTDHIYISTFKIKTQDNNEVESHLALHLFNFCSIHLSYSSGNGNNYLHQMKVYLKIRGSGLA